MDDYIKEYVKEKLTTARDGVREVLRLMKENKEEIAAVTGFLGAAYAFIKRNAPHTSNTVNVYYDPRTGETYRTSRPLTEWELERLRRERFRNW